MLRCHILLAVLVLASLIPCRQHLIRGLLSPHKGATERFQAPLVTMASNLNTMVVEVDKSFENIEECVVAKSLVWFNELNDDSFILVLESSRRIDKAKVQAVLGHSLRLADREAAECITSQKIGTIGPLGKGKFQVLVDSHLVAHENASKVLVGSGKEDKSYLLSVSSLIECTNASVIDMSVIPEAPILNIHHHHSKHLESSGTATHAPPLRNEKPRNSKQTSSGGAKIETMSERKEFSAVKFSPQLLRKTAISSDTVKLMAVIDAARQGIFSEDYNYYPPEYTLADHLNLPSKVGGKTALHLAAWKAPVENVHVLLQNGAAINQWSTNSGNYGKTALFYAITQCRDDVVLSLLQMGSLVTIVNNKGQTPRSLAASHLKATTIQAIEDAEAEQLKSGTFLNFYLPEYRAENETCFGDLDPRFVTDESVKDESVTLDWSTLPRSINPTTVQSRLGRRSTAGQSEAFLQSFMALPSNLSIDTSPTADRIPAQVSQRLLELQGMIVSKRQISASLVFANLAPLSLTRFTSYLAVKYSWKDSVVVESSTNASLFSVQLILGKTLRTTLGEDVVKELCKYVKEGQRVLVRGDIRAISEGKRPMPSQVLYSPEMAPETVEIHNESSFLLRDIDFAVHDIHFLDSSTGNMDRDLNTAVVEPVSSTFVALDDAAMRTIQPVAPPSEVPYSDRDPINTVMSVSESQASLTMVDTNQSQSATEIVIKSNKVRVSAKEKREAALAAAQASAARFNLLPVWRLNDAIGYLNTPNPLGSIMIAESDKEAAGNSEELSTRESPILAPLTMELPQKSISMPSDVIPVILVNSPQSVAEFSSLIFRHFGDISVPSPHAESIKDEQSPMVWHEHVVAMDCEWRPDGEVSHHHRRHRASQNESIATTAVTFDTEADTDVISSISVKTEYSTVSTKVDSEIPVYEQSTKADGAIGSEDLVVTVEGIAREGVNISNDDGLKSKPSSYTYVETLQLSTRHAVFVLDLPTIVHTLPTSCLAEVDAALSVIFASPAVWMLGYDCAQDFQRLAASYPVVSAFQKVTSVVDLQVLAKSLYPGRVTKQSSGLSKLSATLFQRKMDKTQQCSPWHLRPFTPAQVRRVMLCNSSLWHSQYMVFTS